MSLEFISPHKYGHKPYKPSANIKMEYLYRDAGNNKLRSCAIFTNNYQLTICRIANFVRASFIDGGWFDPDLCGIEKLVFERYDSDLDHDWHEIELIRETDELATSDVDIADFLFSALKAHAHSVYDNCQAKEIEFEL